MQTQLHRFAIGLLVVLCAVFVGVTSFNTVLEGRSESVSIPADGSFSVIQDQLSDGISLLHLGSFVRHRSGAAQNGTGAQEDVAIPLMAVGSEGVFVRHLNSAEDMNETGRILSSLLQFRSLVEARGGISEEGSLGVRTHMIAYVIVGMMVVAMAGFAILFAFGRSDRQMMQDNWLRQQDESLYMKRPSSDQFGPTPQNFQGGGSSASLLPGASMPPGSGQLCPELSGAIVPNGRKFIVKVPCLKSLYTHEETALRFKVETKDSTPMFLLKVLSHRKEPQSTAGEPEEYITLSIPEEEERELVVCAIGRMNGQPECHIFKFAKEPFAIIRPDNATANSFSLILSSGQVALTAMVSGGDGNRTIKIVHSAKPNADIAMATQLSGDSFEVQCYPLCDIILTIMVMAGVERLAAKARA